MADLPPAGWYDDPTSPTHERWWDGERWSEQTRTKAPEAKARPGELRPVGDYLGHAFGMIRARWDDFLLVTVFGSVLLALAGVALIRPIIVSIDVVNNRIVGFGSTEVGLLIGFVVFVVVVTVTLAMSQYRIAWTAAIDEPGGWATALQYGLANSVRFVGWIIVALAPLIAGVVLFVVLARLGAGLAALLFLAFLVAAAWWAIVMSFVPAALVIQPRGTNPITSSIATVKGRWWRIFGRLFVMGLIVGIVLQVLGAILAQIVGPSFVGIEIIESGGDIDIEKGTVSTALEFFLGLLVFWFVSLLGNVATFSGVISMAFDAMPRSGGGSPADDITGGAEF